MDKQKEFKNRKHPRLKKYDYSSAGAYFITICTEGRKNLLSCISDIENVGRGLAPADNNEIKPALTLFGEVAEKQLLSLENRFANLEIDSYVIMPNHIHIIVILNGETVAGASPRPTLMNIVSVYKSMTTLNCKKRGLRLKKLFQTSFFEHIIRNKDDYEKHIKYIIDNPRTWLLDELYTN